MEKKINTLKSKSVIIDGQLHADFKRLCKGKNLKIGAVIEDLIALFLKNPKEIQILIDNDKDNESNKNIKQ